METFLARIRVPSNPSQNKLISAIMLLSGTIIEIGLNMDFRLSGSSVRPAYPGFIVMKMPHVCTNFISYPSNTNLTTFCERAVSMDSICCATTDNTSMFILLKDLIIFAKLRDFNQKSETSFRSSSNRTSSK